MFQWILAKNLSDGRKERVQFDKITARVSRLCYGLDADHVDAAAITQKVISGVYQGVTTVELDNLVRDLSSATFSHDRCSFATQYTDSHPGR
jgi:hypothetical protein